MVVGQPCTCVAAGFRIAQVGLAALCDDDGPVRGELRLVASNDHAVSDVVAFILGAERRADRIRSSLVIDPSLSSTPGVWRYLLADPARHRAVMVTYYKSKLMPDPLRTRLGGIEERAERGDASRAERELFRREMARMVQTLLDPEASSAFFDVRIFSYEAFGRRYPALASPR